jgi:hypothetical protein
LESIIGRVRDVVRLPEGCAKTTPCGSENRGLALIKLGYEAGEQPVGCTL